MNRTDPCSDLKGQYERLKKTKRLDLACTPEAWLRLLGPAARSDARIDRWRMITGGVFWISLFAAPLGFALPEIWYVVLPLLPVSALVWWLTRRADLGNQLREFLLPWLALMGDDVKRGRPLHLHLDLRGGTHKAKRVETLPPYRKEGYLKVVETRFEDPWLVAEAVLADGARLRLRLTDHIRRLKLTKRTPRGKTKFKTKYKIRGLVDVHLKVPGDRYRVARPFGDAARVQVDEEGNWLRLRARQVVRRPGEALQSPPLEPVLDLLAGLYRHLESRNPGEGSHA